MDAKYRRLDSGDSELLLRMQREYYLTDSDEWLKWVPPEWGRCLVVNGEVVAGLILYTYRCHYGSDLVSMVGVGGVGAAPQHRRKGYVRRLLVEALREMRGQEVATSTLYPFSYQFYRKFGWELGRLKVHYEFKPSLLGQLSRVPGEARPMGPESHDPFDAVYRRWCLEHNGLAVRDAASWARKLGERPGQVKRRYVWYSPDSQDPRGYVIFRVEEGKEEWQRHLAVQELVALDTQAYLGLLRLLGLHESQFETVRWTAPVEDPLLCYVAEPRQVEAELWPHFMIRLVHLPKALASRSVPEGMRGVLVIECHDEVLPENQGPWEVELGPDGVGVRPSSRPADISADIGVLSQVYVGFLTPVQACRLGGMRGEPAALEVLGRWWGPRPPALEEYF